MNSERCSQCKHFIIANAGEGKIYGCDRSKCVFEPTTKNDLGVETTQMIDKSNFSQEQYKADLQSAYDCGYAQAKNDLGVDCISRQEAIDTIRQLYLDLTSQKAVIDLLKVLPSVKPQEPRKGHWVDCKCDKCGYVVQPWNTTSFCPNCGVDMREIKNDERRSNNIP